MQKYFRHILFMMLVLSISFACTRKTVVVQQKKDNGKHKGWYKNPNNPHHPASTKHQSKGKGGTTVIVNNNNSNKSHVSASGHNKVKPGNSNASAKGNPGKGNGNGNGKGKK